MEVIKGIIAKLDVPLAQVLIEAVIIDVTLGNTFNFGVSAAQNPAANGNVIGGGGVNNGSSPFANFVKTSPPVPIPTVGTK
jgi:type II secretory pathway component GspD/PulD (secretin)